MKIIVDTNIIISALVKDGLTRKFLFFAPFDFYTVDHAKSEIYKHINELIIKSKISEEAFQYLLDLIFNEIQMVELDIIEPYKEKAVEIMKIIDINDAPFIALALYLNSPIWSNDKHMKQQNIIKIYQTEEMIKLVQ